jgi:hypothetical protein
MTEEHVSVALASAHAPVSEHHVSAAIIHRSTGARAEEVDQELLLALDAVFTAMRPEAAELGIRAKPRQQIIRHRDHAFSSVSPRVRKTHQTERLTRDRSL